MSSISSLINQSLPWHVTELEFLFVWMMGILLTFIGGLLWDRHQIYQIQQQQTITLNYFHFRDSLYNVTQYE